MHSTDPSSPAASQIDSGNPSPDKSVKEGTPAPWKVKSILVAVASYGEKNRHHLERVLDAYRAMPWNIKLVLLSEAPKDLGPDVEVRVGLPDEDNSWSLPFAHKAVLAEGVDDYDLFIYTEDDLYPTERHIQAFLELGPCLEPDEIAGYLRYEIDESGQWFVHEPWKHFHWKPGSVRQRGPHTVAEFTNEHAGFYILTPDQLRRAIASGNYLCEPYRDRYDWPETAATDPYTVCGFRKVVSTSNVQDFLLHHMPNPYLDRLEVTLEDFRQQIETLHLIRDRQHPAHTMFAVESAKFPRAWQKSYYEMPGPELLDTIPNASEAKRVLSMGCGWGELETQLQARGQDVTAIPLDSVIGAQAAKRGIRVVQGDWESVDQQLAGETFDAVVLTDLLHLQENPADLIQRCAGFLKEGGQLILGGPNFNRGTRLLKRILNLENYARLRSFEDSGITPCSPRTLRPALEQAGLQPLQVTWTNHGFSKKWLKHSRAQLGVITARHWILLAERRTPQTA